jgi:hypothetical protein
MPAVRSHAPARRPTIFELLSEYQRSLESMELWLATADLTESERIGIADAWQQEMAEWFRNHGFCFGCNRPLDRCACE